MFIAKQKRKENIAEYILYLWQLEDLLRALDLNADRIYRQLIEPQTQLNEEQKQVVFERIKSGVSISAIAREFKTSRQTILRAKAKLQTPDI